MKSGVILGIDTSNYTTSVALMSQSGELIANLKRPLPVKAGERGLRQSDAVFSHIKNLPDILKEAKGILDGVGIAAVGVSERPRNIEGSYMPCFLAGVSAAESAALAAHAPLYRFSHQCGHIMAAVYSSGKEELLSKSFAAFHVSGGTTELLRVTRDGFAFRAELVGGTADLNAGQVIDRIGVLMGLPFPAGAHIEALAMKNTKTIPRKKPPVRDLQVSLSGLENLAERLYRDSGDASLTSAFLLDYIGRALLMLTDGYISEFGSSPVLYAGGVMSNSIIKKMLAVAPDRYFAAPALSSDNAVGIAALARRAYLSID